MSDYTGQKFFRLTATMRLSKKGIMNPVWEFKCDCGNLHAARIGTVVAGRVKSCGCYQVDRLRDRQRKRFQFNW